MNNLINVNSSTNDDLNSLIFKIRGYDVMVAPDLAAQYKVVTIALIQAVKRNSKRFPSDFMFQLTKEEQNELITKCDRFANLKHSSTCTYAFTEMGTNQLSSVLNSDIAAEVSVRIARAFVVMKDRIKEIESKVSLKKMSSIDSCMIDDKIARIERYLEEQKEIKAAFEQKDEVIGKKDEVIVELKEKLDDIEEFYKEREFRDFGWVVSAIVNLKIKEIGKTYLQVMKWFVKIRWIQKRYYDTDRPLPYSFSSRDNHFLDIHDGKLVVTKEGTECLLSVYKIDVSNVFIKKDAIDKINKNNLLQDKR